MRSFQVTPFVLGCLCAAWFTGCAQADDGSFDSAEQALMLDFAELGEYRSIDGTGNNQQNPQQGSQGDVLLRLGEAAYADGVSAPAGPDRASARAISNQVLAQSGSTPNSSGLTDMFWLWGQFVDHDIDLTLVEGEEFDIPVPTGDAFFDPQGTGNQVISFTRSAFTVISGVREQENDITAYIDGSNVYGSTAAIANSLRAFDGSGRLTTGSGDLLPTQGGFFVAGDVRANENIYLTAMHTLWMREHNYWATFFKQQRPYLSEQAVYSLARAVVGAEIQSITYNEFLPLLLGPNALDDYSGYDSSVHAGIGTEFSTAAYRFGHSMLSGSLLRLQADGSSIPTGPVALRDAFFNPNEFLASGGVTPLLRGAAGQLAQQVDELIVDDVRNFLFGQPGQGGFDLGSLNIQRGRDHGLPSYNETRVALGLSAANSFADVTSDTGTQARLAAAYDDVDDMDLWVAGLAEDPVAGGLVGPTFRAIIADQFQRLRDGDRFFYENHLTANMATTVRHTKLSTVIRRNTEATIFDLRHEVLTQMPAAESSLLGFESAGQWTVSNGSISSNGAYATDGSRSLDVAGSGHIRVSNAGALPASALAGGSTLAVDVFVPATVANYYNAGTTQAILNCPVAGIYQAFLGQVELNYMPRGQFNTARYAIPSYLQNALAQNPNAACTVTLTLNLDGTVDPYGFDRLRVE